MYLDNCSDFSLIDESLLQMYQKNSEGFQLLEKMLYQIVTHLLPEIKKFTDSSNNETANNANNANNINKFSFKYRRSYFAEQQPPHVSFNNISTMSNIKHVRQYAYDNKNNNNITNHISNSAVLHTIAHLFYNLCQILIIRNAIIKVSNANVYDRANEKAGIFKVEIAMEQDVLLPIPVIRGCKDTMEKLKDINRYWISCLFWRPFISMGVTAEMSPILSQNLLSLNAEFIDHYAVDMNITLYSCLLLNSSYPLMFKQCQLRDYFEKMLTFNKHIANDILKKENVLNVTNQIKKGKYFLLHTLRFSAAHIESVEAIEKSVVLSQQFGQIISYSESWFTEFLKCYVCKMNNTSYLQLIPSNHRFYKDINNELAIINLEMFNVL